MPTKCERLVVFIFASIGDYFVMLRATGECLLPVTQWGLYGLEWGACMASLLGAVALALIASTAVMNTAAMARSCDDDSIDTVSDDGAIVTMNSGAVFRVESSGRSDTAFWHSWDDVLICKDDTEIINKDQNGEHVSVARIR
jgi:hypothetical protein